MNIDEMRKRYEQMLRDEGADEVAIRVLGQAYATGAVEYEIALLDLVRGQEERAMQ